jgi:hypothetical protein
MDKYQILLNKDFQIPISLENDIDDLGFMSEFDGNIIEYNNVYNFSYIVNNKKITLYISGKYELLLKQNFIIDWGDNNESELIFDITDNNLYSIEHTYINSSNYTISVKFITPWNKDIISKSIIIPNDITIPNQLGTISGIKIPYTDIENVSQNYLNDLDNKDINYTGVTYMVVTQSRINEKKLYGNNKYKDITLYNDNDIIYTGYTIDNIEYRDYIDGFTIMVVKTNEFTREEILEKALTRNEMFLGFIDEPTVYSDIFVERGKNSISELNNKISQINNLGNLTNNNNFKVFIQ